MGFVFRVFSLLFIILLFSTSSFGEVDLNIDYTSEDFYKIAIELEKEYPDLLEVEVIGYSTDEKPIYVVRLTEMNDHHKMHYLIEGGLHSRETASTPIIMKTIEMYLKDYHDDTAVAGVSIRSLLEDSVIHFIPLSNPDGYDFATWGIGMLSVEGQKKLRSIRETYYPGFKANINGVDLNRNFPGLYYDIENDKWINIWNVEQNDYISNRPSGSFYHGPYEASEDETKVMMTYLLSYDFRNYLSYHSRGEILYWYKWMLSDKHNEDAYRLASLISKITGYEPINTNQYGSSSGYLTDYVSMQTLKPSITVETLSGRESLPASNYSIKRAFEKMLKVPALAVVEGRRVGYFDYKWYKDGLYIRDYEELEYAAAMKDKYGGIIIKRQGTPSKVLTNQLLPVTRLELIELITKGLDVDYSQTQPFKDIGTIAVRKARSLGIVSGYEGYFRPYDYVTYGETLVMIRKAYFSDSFSEYQDRYYHIEDWARESVSVLLNEKIIDYSYIKVGNISLGEVEKLMSVITGGNYDRVD
jgi:g-D-glutamyl-meso-diaminopimelate peptidase